MSVQARLILAGVLAGSGCRDQPASNDSAQREPAPTQVQPTPPPTIEPQAEVVEPDSETGNPETPDAIVPTLADQLRDHEGGPLPLLVGTRTRLLATDGDLEQILVEARIRAASYDSKRQVIWYVSGSKLHALDLLAPFGDPRVIVERIPNEASIALPDAGVWLGHDGVPEFLLLEWANRPTLELGLTFGDIFNEDIAKAIEQAKLVDPSWLDALRDRPARGVPATPKPRRITDAPHGECWEEVEVCGRAITWPNSSWKLYVSEYNCGDYCYWLCSLWDSKGKRTADPGTLPSPAWESGDEPVSGSCGPFYTDASGTLVTIGDQLCRGNRCTKLPGRPLGFLDPGRTLQVSP